MRALLILLFATSLAAETADLRLELLTQPPPVLEPGERSVMDLGVENRGPDTARNVRVELRFSPGLKRIASPILACTPAGEDAVVCPLPDLAPAGTARRSVQYEMPFATGTYGVTATVLSGTPPDPVPANNSVTLSYDVPRAAGAHVSASSFDRVDPGQAATVRVSVHRKSRVLGAETIPAGTIVEARFTVADGATIESVDAPAHWSCTIDGAAAACRTVSPGSDCCGTILFSVRAPQDRAGGIVPFEAEAVVQRPSLDLPARAAGSFEVFRHAMVTNTDDAGPGSLRAAIEEVNEHCSTHPCKLRFDLPPPLPDEGVSTIVPATPLPPIVADRIFIDAMTGERRTIVLDGTRAGKGLEMHVSCEGVLRGLTFRNFDDQGLWYTQRRPCEDSVRRSFFLSDNFFENNRRGLILDGAPFPRVQGNVIRNNRYSGVWMWRGSVLMEFNTIEDNGASGIFLGPAVGRSRILNNWIERNAEMGVAAARGATEVEISTNRMRGNGGLGIDWGLDGPSTPRDDYEKGETNAPALLSAVYDPATGHTNVTLTVRTRPLPGYFNPYVVVELFANDAPDGDGETPLYNALAPHTDGTPFTFTLRGDHRRRWLNATATRAVRTGIYLQSVTTNEFGDVGWTSELSNAVYVSP